MNKHLSEYLLLVQNVARKLKNQFGAVHSTEIEDLESIGLFAVAQTVVKNSESDFEKIKARLPIIIRNAMIDALRQKGSGTLLTAGRVSFRRLMNTRKLAVQFKNQFGSHPLDYDLRFFVIYGRWPEPANYLSPKKLNEKEYSKEIVPLSELAPWLQGASSAGGEALPSQLDWMNSILVRDELELVLSKLVAKERILVREFILNAKPAEEVAKTLGITVANLNVTKHRIIQRLKASFIKKALSNRIQD